MYRTVIKSLAFFSPLIFLHTFAGSLAYHHLLVYIQQWITATADMAIWTRVQLVQCICYGM